MSATAESRRPAPTSPKQQIGTPEPKTYLVLSPSAPHEVVLKGKYPTPDAAFAAAAAKQELSDGDTLSYIVVAEKFFKPRTVKAQVERKLVFS